MARHVLLALFAAALLSPVGLADVGPSCGSHHGAPVPPAADPGPGRDDEEGSDAPPDPGPDPEVPVTPPS